MWRDDFCDGRSISEELSERAGYAEGTRERACAPRTARRNERKCAGCAVYLIWKLNAGIIQGQRDTKLNERGELQARITADALRGEPITRFIASPLQRAYAVGLCGGVR